MGQLVDGVWRVEPLAATDASGAFVRSASRFRRWITPDGRPGPTGEGGFAAEPGRYHLYVSLACPWAHRTLIARALEGLETLVGVSVVSPFMGEDGWTFARDYPGATGDALHGAGLLREIYLRADPRASGRVTVPVLSDRARGAIVSNESADIVRMFDTAFDALTGGGPDLRPAPLRDEIDRLNALIHEKVNDGVYRAGFARTQAAYDAAVRALFDALDSLEALLGRRRHLAGDRITEADLRLYPTLVRFDPIYHGHVKCNLRRIAEYPNLLGWLREFHQIPGVAATTDVAHAKAHYYVSHRAINPTGVVPVGDGPDLTAPHGRDRCAAA